MKTFHYYLRDNSNRPLVTVCLGIDTKGQYYRGVAICSPKDNPNKRTGRQIAVGRVLQAMHHKKSSGLVYRDEAVDVLDQVKALNPYYMKSTYYPMLTPIEIEILKNIKEK